MELNAIQLCRLYAKKLVVSIISQFLKSEIKGSILDMPPTQFCPFSHPYPYLNGAYCCKSSFEKVSTTEVDVCDGGPISWDSTCCHEDLFVTCPSGNCYYSGGKVLPAASICNSNLRYGLSFCITPDVLGVARLFGHCTFSLRR